MDKFKEQPSFPALPDYVLDNIFNRLDARDVARVQSVCRELRKAGENVLSLRIICLDEYHERVRNDRAFEGKSFRSIVSDESRPSKSGSSQSSTKFTSFKDLVGVILKSKHSIVQLRIEVEAKLQSKSVAEGESRRTDFWLADPYFWSKCLPHMGATLQHLCIVDYGQQAIMRRSQILNLLSEKCSLLKTLDLRNLFIDTSEIEVMPNMVSLKLRCVEVVGDTLQHLNDKMPNLQTLVLLAVYGADGGILKFQFLYDLCLGLSTPAKDVQMDCPNLEKLQLKMQCPQKLIIRGKALRYVSFNLDVMEPSEVELKSMVGVRELIYAAMNFERVESIIERSRESLQVVFLDIPCMALAKDGRLLRVLNTTTVLLPSFNKLSECEELEVLNIGPGLWYVMETHVPELVSTMRWPSMKRLVLHMIPHDMDAGIELLRTLLRTSVAILVVLIHKSSPVTRELITPRIEEIVRSCGRNIDLNIGSWQDRLGRYSGSALQAVWYREDRIN